MPHPYAPFLEQVRKPGRYLGGEYGQVRKDPETVELNLCLAFPDLYDIGMSHLGTKILYTLLNRDPRIACERCFTPWPDMEAALRAHDLPLLSLENHRPLRDFDVVGISLQYEMTYTNVLTLLELGGIPLHAEERGEEDPLVIGGGPTALHPEPVAPFFDLFFIGEAEQTLGTVLLRYKELRRNGGARQDSLIALVQEFPGLYAPALYALEEEPRTGALVVGKPLYPGVPPRVQRVWVDELDRFPFPDDFPVPLAEAVFDRMSIEIARGCTEGCRFCQAGMVYRPVRERSPREVIRTVLSAVNKGGFDEVSLTSLSTADYSCIEPLVHDLGVELRRERVSLSVSSLRAYGLDGGVLDDIRSVRATGLTFAPEAGTQRMRNVINKNVTEEDLLACAREVFSRGWERMKLYFMIGLPTETDADVLGIVDTAERTRDEGRRARGGGRPEVTISVSSHVPKPHTPFQWAAMDSITEIERKQELLREAARPRRLKLKWHDARISYLEGIAARGDRRVAVAIEDAWRRGCRFDGWSEHLRFDLWVEALTAAGLELERYLGTLPVDARLPWDHIDVGVEAEFVRKEYRKAVAGRFSPPCGKPFQAQAFPTHVAAHDADTRKLICYDCGIACDMERMRDDRRTFLESMQAFQKRQRDAGEEPAQPTAPATPAAPQRRRGHRQPPATFTDRPGFRFRLRYAKLKADRFIGHLDTIRVWPRVFRRAGIPLNYSRGFHPHPLLSFGPALPLGTASLGEYLDLVSAVDLPPEEMRERLNAHSSEGLRVEAVERLEPGAPKLVRVLQRAEYLLVYSADAWEPADLAAQARALLAREEILVLRRDKKGRERERDLRPLIVALQPTRVEGLDPRLGVADGALGVRLDLRLDQGWLLRPADLMPLLDPTLPAPLLTVRLGCWHEVDGQCRDPLAASSV